LVMVGVMVFSILMRKCECGSGCENGGRDLLKISAANVV
jgi:hypothetical protein